VQGDIDRPFTRLGSLPALLPVMVALRFYACGCFQIVVGNIFSVDKSTVSRIIERISRAFSSRINEYVRLPRRNEATKTINKFYQMANFPSVHHVCRKKMEKYKSENSVLSHSGSYHDDFMVLCCEDTDVLSSVDGNPAQQAARCVVLFW
jgi:hypothetical protein